jgi:hypothetical protein
VVGPEDVPRSPEELVRLKERLFEALARMTPDEIRQLLAEIEQKLKGEEPDSV